LEEVGFWNKVEGVETNWKDVEHVGSSGKELEVKSSR